MPTHKRYLLVPDDYAILLIKDLGSVRLNPDSKKPHRRALWECPDCKKPFEAAVSNVKRRVVLKCSPCARFANRKYKNEKDVLQAKANSIEKNKKTKRGMLGLIYSSQKTKSKKRGHPMPNYTIEEFLDFAYSRPNFSTLYDSWISSGCDKELRPSFDRTDPLKPYTLSNLVLMTWQENNNKGRTENYKARSILELLEGNTRVMEAIKEEFKNDIRVQLFFGGL